MTTIVPATAAGSAAASPRRERRGSIEPVLLLLSAALLAISGLLPWWSESETLGGSTWTQTFSPLWGVSGECTPSCPTFGTGPPLGPIQGTHTLASLGMAQTGLLYLAALGVTVTALALVLAALVAQRFETDPPNRTAPPRAGRRLLTLGAVVTGIGAAALPVLQPIALRNDTMSKFTSENAWTASPSPETSFWGACTRGAYNGLCASGWSATWGPDWGWIALLLALALIVVVLWTRRGRAAEPEPASPG